MRLPTVTNGLHDTMLGDFESHCRQVEHLPCFANIRKGKVALTRSPLVWQVMYHDLVRIGHLAQYALYAAAMALCQQERYRRAGTTIEFVLDAQSQAFHFLEMNTRIQTEHLVSARWSRVLDLIAMQRFFAADKSLPIVWPSDIQARDHAIECRNCAERPGQGL